MHNNPSIKHSNLASIFSIKHMGIETEDSHLFLPKLACQIEWSLSSLVNTERISSMDHQQLKLE